MSENRPTDLQQALEMTNHIGVLLRHAGAVLAERERHEMGLVDRVELRDLDDHVTELQGAAYALFEITYRKRPGAGDAQRDDALAYLAGQIVCATDDLSTKLEKLLTPARTRGACGKGEHHE